MRHLISITSSCMSWTIPARQCSCRDWSRPLRLEQSANHDSNDIFSTQDRNENSKVLLVNSEVVLIYYSGISWRVTTLAYGTSEVHEKKKTLLWQCFRSCTLLSRADGTATMAQNSHKHATEQPACIRLSYGVLHKHCGFRNSSALYGWEDR